MTSSLLIVDDDIDVSKSLYRLLRRDRYKIYIAESGEEALELLNKHAIHVVVSDQRMPHMTGAELLTRVKEQYPETIRIIISGYSDFQAVNDAINNGEIYKFLAKPWDGGILRADIRQAFQVHGLREKNRQLSYLFDSTIEAIVLTDDDGVVESVNPAFSLLSHFQPESIIGTPITQLFVSPTGTPLPEALLQGKSRVEWHGELSCKKSNGEIFPVWVNFMPINNLNKVDSEGKESGQIAALFIDITEQKKKEARIEYQAYHDNLTGLPNRRLFDDHLELALHQSRRKKNYIGVLFIDLDRFKNVNDSLGHEVGDALLIEVSRRLETTIRRGETLARFGGDEFIIVLPSISRLQECEVVASKVVAVFNKPFICHNKVIHIYASVGVSASLADEGGGEVLVRNADNAMYRAKKKGGNCFQIFDEGRNRHLNNAISVENALHDALDRDEFVVFFQPQVNSSDEAIHNCESLVRWQHPDKGIVFPGDFIPLAEETGLILPMGKSILEKSCKQLSIWRYQHNIRCNLSVNISARQFNDTNLLKMINQALVNYKIDPQWLELEVTESVILNDMKSSIATLYALRDIGIRIAMDDFGTGYSSLSYLKQLPIDTLKIDQEFIRDIPNEKKSSVIVHSIINLAKGLGLSIVAEGVETKEQFDFLKEQGCDLIQGYYFSRPVCNKDFISLVNKANR